jgi:hypothetical protein
MTPPWFQYEAYGMKMTNNLIYESWGAGLGVVGSYSTLVAHNTMYRCAGCTTVLPACTFLSLKAEVQPVCRGSADESAVRMCRPYRQYSVLTDESAFGICRPYR